MTRKRLLSPRSRPGARGHRRRGARSDMAVSSRAVTLGRDSSKTAEAFRTGRSMNTFVKMSSRLCESNMTLLGDGVVGVGSTRAKCTDAGEPGTATAAGPWRQRRWIRRRRRIRRRIWVGGRTVGHRLPGQRLEFLVPAAATDLTQGQPTPDHQAPDRAGPLRLPVHLYDRAGPWLSFSPEEAAALRHYLLNGGFLMVDDFWGDAEYENFHQQMKSVFPEDKYEPKELPLEHEIFHCVYPPQG